MYQKSHYDNFHNKQFVKIKWLFLFSSIREFLISSDQQMHKDNIFQQKCPFQIFASWVVVFKTLVYDCRKLLQLFLCHMIFYSCFAKFEYVNSKAFGASLLNWVSSLDIIDRNCTACYFYFKWIYQPSIKSFQALKWYKFGSILQSKIGRVLGCS